MNTDLSLFASHISRTHVVRTYFLTLIFFFFSHELLFILSAVYEAKKMRKNVLITSRYYFLYIYIFTYIYI